MEVAPNIFKFDSGPFNWYVIEENGRLTLVDAGFAGHYSIFLKGIEAMSRSVKDLEAIVLTHAHADHTGFAEKLRRQTNVPVYVHKADVAMASKPLQLPWVGLVTNVWRKNVFGMVSHAVMNGLFTMPRITKTVAVGDNAVLDAPGKPRVIHTPGHTEGEISLYFENSRALLCGDTLATLNIFSGDSGEPVFVSEAINGDARRADRSLDKIKELGQATLLPGHGKPWSGTMEEAVTSARQKSKN